MNSLFNSALKQSSSVRRDLDAFSESPTTSSPALQGQIQASLTSFSRTIDDYAELAKKELVQAKQEKAQDRIKNFKSELSEYRGALDRLRKDREDAVRHMRAFPHNKCVSKAQNRTELFGRRPHHAATPENPYAQAQLAQNSPFAPPRNNQTLTGAAPQEYTREQHAFREQNFMTSTNAALDEYLERGRAVLGDLGQQREMLKGTQKKLYSVANTLGVSGDTIRMVERRAKRDKWIFWAGVIIFVLFVWLVIHFLR
ncbi:MAG: protein transport protein bos1 [Ramalina farinacea]|uniref:Protein transport protein BOS1 n=1 Tax=Ramalina farinacea TaxID=258253 RepID=A0AA43QXH5_9LECA|nr:protein transport protein bos1 [Ramalina farinacea]